MFFNSQSFCTIFIFYLCSVTFAAPTNGSNLIEIRASTAFVHPGVLLDGRQLRFIKSKVKGNINPWHDAYESLRSGGFGSLQRRPHPHAHVNCGYFNKPNYGCRDEVYDALSAYATSLLWYVTGDRKYAQKSIEYMNSWAKVIKTHGSKNAKIQAGWAAASWTRAAEIIRHTNGGWAQKDILRFENMLRNVYLPGIIGGAPPRFNGNWDLGKFGISINNKITKRFNWTSVILEAIQGIAIFLDDHALYQSTMAKYHLRVPAYIYLRSDGAYPKTVPSDRLHSRKQIESYWNGQSKFLADGIVQETCRDLGHTGSGLSSIAHIAETSRIQGNNFYHGDVGNRLHHALELHSHLEMHGNNNKWLCGGHIKRGLPPS